MKKEQFLTPEQSAELIKCLEELEDYFHAHGSGLSQEFIVKEASQLKKILSLSSSPTRELIEQYVKLKKSNVEEDGIGYKHVIRVLETRVATDVEAKAFCQERSNALTEQRKEELKKIRNCFLLPDSELILEHSKISCNGVSGETFVSSSYLLFDIVNSPGADSGHQLAVELKDLISLQYEKKLLGLKEISQVVAKEGQYVFSSTHALKPLMMSIAEIAKRAGNNNLTIKE